MKKKGMALLMAVCLSASSYAAKSPVGYWVAMSPFFYGKPLAIVKTYMVKDKLCGQIVKVLPLNGSFGAYGKMASSGPVMMCGYQEKDGRWEGGKVYEQITAKVYSSTITVSDDGNHLYVRGYRGPFYRTVRWDRIR